MSIGEPLRFAPLPLTKVWGGQRLQRFLGEASPDGEGPVGEVWQLADRDGSSSVVAEGPFQGRSLRGLMMSEGDAILGPDGPRSFDGHFPLLIKLLDAGDNLSVQVHPDRTAALRLGCGACSKSEAWYILEAEPGSHIYFGLKAGVDAKAFAARASTPDVVDLLEMYPVRAGQFVSVPAGTVHAIGAGVTLAEIQENSDTTYRMFDWGRLGLDGKPRELHVEEALKSVDYDQELSAPVDAADVCGPLLDSEAFRIEFVASDTDGLAGGKPAALVVLEGRGQLAYEGGAEPRPLEMGQTWLLPADLGQRAIQGASKLFRALLVQPGVPKKENGRG